MPERRGTILSANRSTQVHTAAIDTSKCSAGWLVICDTRPDTRGHSGVAEPAQLSLQYTRSGSGEPSPCLASLQDPQ